MEQSEKFYLETEILLKATKIYPIFQKNDGKRVIGVFQTPRIERGYFINNDWRYDERIEKLEKKQEIPKDLISIVYHPHRIDNILMSYYLLSRPSLKRVKLFEFCNVPDFSLKTTLDSDAYFNHIQSIRESIELPRGGEIFFDKIKIETEKMMNDFRTYGLTLKELTYLFLVSREIEEFNQFLEENFPQNF